MKAPSLRRNGLEPDMTKHDEAVRHKKGSNGMRNGQVVSVTARHPTDSRNDSYSGAALKEISQIPLPFLLNIVLVLVLVLLMPGEKTESQLISSDC